MAGTITLLEVQKRNKERVNVFLDGEYAFPVTIMVAAELKKGQFLSDAEIEQFKQQDQRNKAYNHAIFYLGFRARSRAEIETYLRDKKYSAEVIGDTINRLNQEGYLNDKEFAQTWVQEREQFKPRSGRALRYELRQKGVNDAVIEEVLAGLDEDSLAWQAIESKIRQWRRLEEADFKKKALGFLSRRGFSYDIARQTVDRAWSELNEEPE